MCVLPVQVHEPLARISQLRKRGGMTVDEAARGACAIDRAAQYDLSRIAGKVPLLQPRADRFGNVELAGELGAFGAFAHHGGVATTADQELDRIHENGFAGAGFAREDGESLAQLERGAVNEDEIADFERS